MIMENEPLIQKSVQKKTLVYTRRWWLLSIFALSGCMQNVLWNTWGPIAQSSKAVFGWSDGQIGMFPNLGNIAYILSVFILSYLMDEKGLRISVLICNGLVFIASVIRCITYIPTYATWLLNLSAVLNGIAGTVFMAGPPLLASIWFPPGQRATATAVSTSSQYAGFAISYIIGPQLVSSPKYGTNNHTGSSFDLINEILESTSNTFTNNTECGVAGAILLATIIYFPNKPPTAPSFSASVSRVHYISGIRQIIRMGPVWLIALACAIPIGVNGTWGTSLDLILDPVGVGQTEVGWIGFYATIAGGIAILIIANICGAATLLWFDLICAHVLPYSKVQLYASCILGALFSNCGMPLFYELICETSYPIGEGISGAFLTILSNLSGVMFLLVLQIPNIGTTWRNWALLGSIVMGLLCLLAFPETLGRTNLDIVIKSYTDMVSDFPKAGSSSSELTADCVNTSIATGQLGSGIRHKT